MEEGEKGRRIGRRQRGGEKAEEGEKAERKVRRQGGGEEG